MKGKWVSSIMAGIFIAMGGDGLSVCTEHIDRKHAFCNRNFFLS